MIKPLHTTALSLSVLSALALSGCNFTSDPASYMAKAKEYRQKGDYSSAVIELKNVLVKHPDEGEARYTLGATYNDIGDAKSAEKELRRALDLKYDPNLVMPALGRALIAQGEFKKVLDEIHVEGSAPPHARAEVLVARAQATLALGRADEGKELLRQALATEPELEDAVLLQARLAAGERRVDDALQLVDGVVARNSKSLDGWFLKGDIERMRKDPQAARAAYDKVLELRPDNVQARLSIAMMESEAGHYPQAKEQVDKVLKTHPSHLAGLYTRSLIELRAGNYAQARDAAMQVLRAAPDHVPSLMVAGNAQFALGSYSEAQSQAERALRDVPGLPQARKLLAASLAKTGQVQRAMDVVQEGLKQTANDPALLAMAGELAMERNDFGKAAEYFQRATQGGGDTAAIRTRLGVSRMALGETNQAMEDLESAVKLDSNDYRPDVVLIMSYLRQGKYDDAQQALAQLQKKQPNNPLTYNLWATLDVGRNDAAAARKHLEHALELNPTYVPAAENLANLDLRDKNPKGARQRLESILEKDKNNVQALLVLANLGPRIGASEKEQIAWLQRAAQASPGSVQPLLMMVSVYSRAGDSKNALDAAQRAQAMAADNPQVLEAVGTAQLGAGEKEQALVTFRKLAESQPDSPLALYRLASAQAASNDLSTAAGNLKKVIAARPDFVPAQIALVDLQIRMGRFDDAMALAKRMQQQGPQLAQGYALEGDVLLAQKKPVPAAKAYEAAYERGANSALTARLYATYLEAGQPDKAEAKRAQWLKKQPDDSAVRFYTAEADMRMGHYKTAIPQYEWLLQRQPDNVVVLNNLAWAYQQVKDTRALETAERAYKIKPDPRSTADTLGWILVSRGETAKGIEVLQAAAKAAPDTPAIRYHLAQGFAKAGDKAKARDELQRLLSSTPAQFPERAQAVSLLEQLNR